MPLSICPLFMDVLNFTFVLNQICTMFHCKIYCTFYIVSKPTNSLNLPLHLHHLSPLPLWCQDPFSWQQRRPGRTESHGGAASLPLGHSLSPHMETVSPAGRTWCQDTTACKRRQVVVYVYLSSRRALSNSSALATSKSSEGHLEAETKFTLICCHLLLLTVTGVALSKLLPWLHIKVLNGMRKQTEFTLPSHHLILLLLSYILLILTSGCSLTYVAKRMSPFGHIHTLPKE